MGWVVKATTRPLYPVERPVTHCTGGWVSPRARVEKCRKSHPHQDSIPGPSSSQRVAIQTELSLSTYSHIHCCITRRINKPILYIPCYFSRKRYSRSHFLNRSPNTYEYSHAGFYLKKVRGLRIFWQAVASRRYWFPTLLNKRSIKYSIT
jgi:hypothetical protein